MKLFNEIKNLIATNHYGYVAYLNAENVETHFFIKPLEYKDGKLKVIMLSKNHLIPLEAVLDTDRIEDLSLALELVTNYNNSEALINSLPTDDIVINKPFKERLLKYYQDCYEYNEPELISSFSLVPGVDSESLTLDSTLNEDQISSLFSSILINYQDTEKKRFHLMLNDLAFKTSEGLYIVAYYPLYLDVEKKILVKGTLTFSHHFLKLDGSKTDLIKFLNGSVDSFVLAYPTNPLKALELIKKNTLTIDTNPYIYQETRLFNFFLGNYYENLLSSDRYKLTPLIKNLLEELPASKAEISFQDFVPFLSSPLNFSQYTALLGAYKNEVSVIKGPPGTGKTQLIISTIITGYLNNKSLLICSQNNRPLQEIENRLASLKAPFYLRLGNNKCIAQSYEQMKEFLKISTRLNAEKIRSTYYELKEKNRALALDIESYKSSNDIQKMNLAIAALSKDSSSLIYFIRDYSFLRFEQIHRPEFSSLKDILLERDPAIGFKRFLRYLTTDLKSLKKLFPVMISTNLGSFKLKLDDDQFDYAFMDEAAQSPVPTSLLVLTLVKNVVLIGDEKQLTPIIELNDETDKLWRSKYQIPRLYSYAQNSIMSLVLKVMDPKIYFLNEHYRSQKEIITYNNEAYYDSKMVIQTQDVKINCKLTFVDTSAINELVATSHKEEAKYIAADILINNYQPEDVLILAPFKKQVETLKQTFKINGLKDYPIATIHSSQGDEKKVVYISTAVNDKISFKAVDWLDNETSIFNVATSRAQLRLIVLASVSTLKEKIGRSCKLMKFAEYCKLNGIYISLVSTNPLSQVTFKDLPANKKEYLTKNEYEFKKTLMQICSLDDYLILYSHPKIKEMLYEKEKINPEFLDYWETAHFDFVLYHTRRRQYLIIELDGKEHMEDSKTIDRDFIKGMLIKQSYNLALLRVKNSDRFDFKLLKQLIKTILK